MEDDISEWDSSKEVEIRSVHPDLTFLTNDPSTQYSLKVPVDVFKTYLTPPSTNRREVSDAMLLTYAF